MSTVVVELCGLPGAGKTTLATTLEAALAARGITCLVADREISAAVPRSQRAMRRMRHAASMAVRRPRSTGRTARQFAAVRNGSARDTAAALVQWLAVSDLAGSARSRPGVHLLEEGLVQTAWTLLLRAEASPAEITARALLDAVPTVCRSDLVLLVDAPVEVAADRLGARRSRHSRTQLLAADQRVTELARGRDLLEAVVAATPGAVHRLTVLPGATPSRLAAEAADAIADVPAVQR